MFAAALLVAGLMADDPTPSIPASTTSPTAQIITVTLAGIASIIVALAGFSGIRKRRQAEADAAPASVEMAIPIDLEDRPSRLRERITALETTQKAQGRQLDDLQELMMLHRAVDVATEATIPRRRRKAADQ